MAAGITPGGHGHPVCGRQEVAEGRVDQTEPFVFSADETCDIGNESGSPVTYDYRTRQEVRVAK